MLTFPVPVASFADKLLITTPTFYLDRRDQMSETQGGSVIGVEIVGPRWRTDVTTASIPLGEGSGIEALIEAIGNRNFLMYNPKVPYPRLDPTGEDLTGFVPFLHTVEAGNQRIRVGGLPGGYRLSSGDMLMYQSADGKKRGLHRAIEPATASGAGLTGFFQLNMPVRSFAVINSTIQLKKPAIMMRIIPGSYKGPTGTGEMNDALSFSAMEVFQ